MPTPQIVQRLLHSTLCCSQTGEYGCCFLVWHKRLLYDCDEEVDSKNEPTLMQRAVKTLFGTSAIKSSA